MMHDIQREFSSAQESAGLQCPHPIIADGELHRFKSDGDREKASWYVAFDDQSPTITFGCWKRGIKETKTVKTGSQLTASTANASVRQRLRMPRAMAFAHGRRAAHRCCG